MPLEMSFVKRNMTPIVLIALGVLMYAFFAYNLVRTDYTKLIMLYAALFFVFYKLVTVYKDHVTLLTWVAFGFRAVFILAIPNLSQDFYRFIWDGRLLVEGMNPYQHTVDFFMQNKSFPIAQAQELYYGMGELNASHFSNYPPINQFCFFVGAFFGGNRILGSVVVMRLLIIAADFGTLYVGKKLLEKLELPAYNIFWYVLNPLIIIELTGNLHFEGVMIFFLVFSLYLLHIGKWCMAAFVFALSVSVKLIPLMFLPLFFKWFSVSRKRIIDIYGLKNLVLFYVIIAVSTLLLFIPFYFSGFINNYSKTIGLWFHQFEFNASLYYVARAIGYTFRGYNEIDIIGNITPVIVIIFILIITFFRKNKTTVQLISSMLLVLSFYYFTATTVHPWYIATLLILAVFTNYKFPLVWSFVIILSYLAYLNTNNSENLWIIGLEYFIVYSVFIWEVFINKKADKQVST